MTALDTTQRHELPRVAAPEGEFLLVVHGPGRGRRLDLEAGQAYIVGRDPDADVCLDDGSVSRAHCRIEQAGGCWLVTDLDSTNGTMLGEHHVNRPTALDDGAVIRCGAAALKFFSATNPEAAYYEAIHQQIITDGLTGLPNRRALDGRLAHEVTRAQRHNRELCVLFFDLDRFKSINDTHGHLAGDAALCHLVRTLSPRIRRDELFARYAGDEFVIVLPETDLKGALVMAEELRARIAETPFVFEGRALRMSISLGVAQLEAHHTPAGIIADADAALYRAKAAGRNAVST